MKYIIVFILFFSYFLWGFSPIVSLEVDKKNIYLGENVNVTLSIIADKKDEKKIKFVHREKLGGFKIIKRGGKDSYDTIADGDKTIDVVEKKIFYRVAPTKDTTIGPLNLFVGDKEYKTRAIKIKIIKDSSLQAKKEITTSKEQKENTSKKEAPKVAQKEITPPKPKIEDIKKEIKIKLSSNKKEVIEGEPFVVNVIYSEPMEASIGEIKYQPPSFKDFKLLKKEEKSVPLKNNLVRSIKYALLPQKSGSFTISPAILSLNIANPLIPSFGFVNATSQIENIYSNPLNIKVSNNIVPVDVIGNYKIDTQINKKITTANKQIVYYLTITGEGNLEELELPKLKIDNVTVYQDEPKITKEIRKNKFFTTYTQKYVFIAQNSFTIPSIKLQAYSPRFKKVYTLSTKPIDILVNNPTLKNKFTLVSTNTTKASSEVNVVLDTKYYEEKLKKANSKTPLILAFIGGLLLGIFGFIFLPKLLRLIRFKKDKAPLYNSYEEALSILYPHTTKNKEYEEMVAMLYEIINGNKEIQIDSKKLNKLIKQIKEEAL